MYVRSSMNAVSVLSCLRRGGATLARHAAVARDLSRLAFSSNANLTDGVNRHPAGPLHGTRVLDMTRCGGVGLHALMQRTQMVLL